MGMAGAPLDTIKVTDRVLTADALYCYAETEDGHGNRHAIRRLWATEALGDIRTGPGTSR